LTVLDLHPGKETDVVDKNRIEGAGHKAAGSFKEAAGKLTGNEKLKAEGKIEKAGGKVQEAVGKTADEIRRERDRRS
jgi:uncharacterized protein YjbJ (UPF0337 family)